MVRPVGRSADSRVLYESKCHHRHRHQSPHIQLGRVSFESVSPVFERMNEQSQLSDEFQQLMCKKLLTESRQYLVNIPLSTVDYRQRRRCRLDIRNTHHTQSAETTKWIAKNAFGKHSHTTGEPFLRLHTLVRHIHALYFMVATTTSWQINIRHSEGIFDFKNRRVEKMPTWEPLQCAKVTSTILLTHQSANNMDWTQSEEKLNAFNCWWQTQWRSQR